MAWPTPTDYNEAVQDLRASMDDEELRGGEVARTPLGLPMLWSGNFADVYKIHCPATGNTWALKCFTREVRGLAGALPPHRRPPGAGPAALHRRFPVPGARASASAASGSRSLKMRWVEGLTLNAVRRGAPGAAAEPARCCWTCG